MILKGLFMISPSKLGYWGPSTQQEQQQEQEQEQEQQQQQQQQQPQQFAHFYMNINESIHAIFEGEEHLLDQLFESLSKGTWT